jgi:vitamin K-dependent gamma-carboxylase-like protein
MNPRATVGITPWLPWPLAGRPWWTEPVPAERLAALRIGLGAVLLLDVLATCMIQVHDLFGPGSLGSADLLPAGLHHGGLAAEWTWSLLRVHDDPRIPALAVMVWAVAAATLLLGLGSRLSAAVAWMLSVSFIQANPPVHNAGDSVRTIILFYLMLSPCGACWSLDSRWKQRRMGQSSEVFIHPWPLRLLFVQMMVIYFSNGVCKLAGPQWRAGTSLHYVLADVSTARVSYAVLPLPDLVLRLLTWMVLAWELGFPFLAVFRPTRKAALWVGVAIHVGIGLSMELGLFSLYMLCLYLPLIPWERRGGGRSCGVRGVL